MAAHARTSCRLARANRRDAADADRAARRGGGDEVVFGAARSAMTAS